jgi:hypothetical protein
MELMQQPAPKLQPSSWKARRSKSYLRLTMSHNAVNSRVTLLKGDM